MREKTRKLEFIELNRLRVQERNPRTHTKLQIRQIAYSIERFGFTSPILIDEDSRVLAGHARMAAARHIGLKIVPCLRLSMSDVEKKAYVIADNKLALNSGWDIEILAEDLDSLIAAGVDVSLTGFEQFEIDQLLLDAADASPVAQGPEDEHPAPAPEGRAVSQIGDLWLLGRHRLLCGDAKDPGAISRLMAGQTADMVFLDPPYNVRIAGHVRGLGRTQHREFVEASGELSPTDFVKFLQTSFAALEPACRNGAIVFICMDWRHIHQAREAASAVFGEQKTSAFGSRAMQEWGPSTDLSTN